MSYSIDKKRRRGTMSKSRLDRFLAVMQSSPMILSFLIASFYFADTITCFAPCYHQATRLQQPTLSMVQTTGSRGLSRYFQAILSRTRERQRFVTGKYPVIVSVQENPTQKWLDKNKATSILLVNGTKVDRSLASYDRFQWLDDVERQELHDRYASLSFELLAEVNIPKPGYLQMMSKLGAGASAEMDRVYGSATRWNRWKNSTLYKELFLDELVHQRQLSAIDGDPPTIQERLWVTGFSLAGRKGFVKSMDVDSGYMESVNSRSEGMTLWPNEVTSVPSSLVERQQLGKQQELADAPSTVLERQQDGHQYEVTGVPSRLLNRQQHDHENEVMGVTSSVVERQHIQDATNVPSTLPKLQEHVHQHEVTNVPSGVIERQQHGRQHKVTSAPLSLIGHERLGHEQKATSVPLRLYEQLGHQQPTERPTEMEDDALLVSDGFLVPGKDRGGIYVVRNPGNPHSEWTVSLTDREGEGWFYHRAVWVDLTGDGRKSILTARAKLRKVAGEPRGKSDPFTGKRQPNLDEDLRPKNGQLVWLEMPEPHHYDAATGTPLEEDGTEFDPFCSRHLPWKERILARGPDVMFNVADMDTKDDTIEVISSQFFDKKVSLHSIKLAPKPRVVFARVIDDRCGSAFGGILADLRENLVGKDDGTKAVIIDSGSTVDSLKPGASLSHVLVTSHECDYAESSGGRASMIGLDNNPLTEDVTSLSLHVNGKSDSIDGGSLFAYKIPEGRDAWKTEPWIRTTVATGFKVNSQLWNVINPGAPGFVYTFHAKSDDRATGKKPLIAIAGDCAESAYIFRPEKVLDEHSHDAVDKDARYKLMCEIKCGATVGSIGVGYDNLCSVDQESGYAKLYIPCFEQDKILVFALGSGEDDTEDEEGFKAEMHHAKKSLMV